MEKEPRIRVSTLIYKNDKILLVKHKKNNKEYWLLPGGGVDYGEKLYEAAIRELKEELCINIKINGLLGITETIAPNKKRHIVHIIYNAEIKNGDITLGEDKRIVDFNFFSPKELKDIILYPNIKKDVVKWINNNFKNQLDIIKTEWI